MLMRDPNNKTFKRVFPESDLERRNEVDSIRNSLVGHFVLIFILLLAIYLRSSF